MPKAMSSRERMLAAIQCQPVDYTPCSFMIFSALGARCRNQFERIEKELELGLDSFLMLPTSPPATMSMHGDLHGLAVEVHPDVKTVEWEERSADSRYPVLLKRYETPGGSVTVEVERSEDWPHGKRVPMLDDFLIPRSRRFLVESESDLAALEYLLREPSAEARQQYLDDARAARKLADRHGVLLTYGWGSLGDTLGWLCGLRNLPLLAVDRPEFTERLVNRVAAWDRKRMEAALEAGIDLYVRRAWYEGVDFWSPNLYRKFLLPHLQQEVSLAHARGARYAYIHTCGTAPLLEMIVEAGVDVLVGVDPVEGRGTTLRDFKRRTQGRMALWGGVNGFVTVERGTEQEVRRAVQLAMDTLAPGGGFILSPVDNIRDTGPAAWRKVLAFIDEWKRLR